MKTLILLLIFCLFVACRDESTNPINEIPQDAQVKLFSPSDSTFFNNSNSILVVWKNFYNSSKYQLQLATDILCNNIIYSTETSDTTIATPYLDDDWYYWRVRAENTNSEWSDWSSIWSFEINLPPSPAEIVPRTNDTSPVERGIDAIYDTSSPDKNYIYLEWYRNSEQDLKGYKIFRSVDENGNYIEIGNVTSRNRVGIDTCFIDKTCSLNQRYYYFVKAFDEKDQLSESSDTINYKLVEVPVLSYPIYNIGFNNSPTFEWYFHPNYIPQFFIFRLDKVASELYINISTRIIDIGTNYTTNQEWALNKLTQLNELFSGTYRWRIDPVGYQNNMGAESAWLIFVIE